MFSLLPTIKTYKKIVVAVDRTMFEATPDKFSYHHVVLPFYKDSVLSVYEVVDEFPTIFFMQEVISIT